MLELSVRHFWVRLMNNKNSAMTIHAERDSVCMGDDCNAPNARELPYSSDEHISAFLINTVAKYVPNVTNSTWVIISGTGDEIGYIIFDKNSKVNYTLATKRDIYVYELDDSIFCRLK